MYFTLRVIDEFINDKEFPRDSCSKYDIDDLQSFVEEQYNILLQRTRDLQLFLEARDINGMFSDKLLNQLFLPPSLVYLRPLTTYLKRISLLKSFIYDRV